jgi:SPP1 gp7 family putative phage head morphogenesis protein
VSHLRLLAAKTARTKGEPWAEVLAAADRKRQAYERLVLEWAQQGRDALDVTALERALAAGSESEAKYALGSALAIAATTLSARVPPLIMETMAAGGEAAARNARREDRVRFAAKSSPFDDLHFDLVNPESVRWAQTRAGELITGLADASREAVLGAIRSIIAASYTQGIPVPQVARLLREYIGLTPQYAEAVTRLRVEMLANPGRKLWAGRTAIRVPRDGASWDLIAKRSGEYARRLLNTRARVIARTETIAAANQGQLQLWRQAVQQRLLRGTEYKRWIVTPDDRLCPICEGLAGEEVPLEENFSVGVDSPPAHAQCRCTFGLVRRRAVLPGIAA